MDVQIRRNPDREKFEHIYVLLPEKEKARTLGFSTSITELLDEWIPRAGFEGRVDESITFLHEKGRKLTLIGLGKREKITRRSLRIAIRVLGKTAQKNRDKSIAVALPLFFEDLGAARELRLIADLLSHSDYRYDSYLPEEERKKRVSIKAVVAAPEGLSDKEVRRAETEARAISVAVKTTRDLGNTPPNELTPTRMAEIASGICSDLKIKCTVLDLKQIRKLNMGGLLAVNRGSVEEPRFVVMEHSPARAKKTVVLVGKGITFDSGGISIKPSERMEEMKFDMSGAGTVIGIMEAVARLDLKIRVVGIVAATENLPSGSAYKPGDIIRMMSGKTVEIINTDAEGRMILGDALHYAARYEPDHMLDFATLTGACVVALGSEASGLFTSDEALAQMLIESGSRAGERLWRLPEWDEYKEAIKSEWANVKNSGGRWAGATTAAVFLKEFVSVDSWAHIDMAGTAYAEQESSREARGATGWGVRSTVEFLESLV